MIDKIKQNACLWAKIYAANPVSGRKFIKSGHSAYAGYDIKIPVLGLIKLTPVAHFITSSGYSEYLVDIGWAQLYIDPADTAHQVTTL